MHITISQVLQCCPAIQALTKPNSKAVPPQRAACRGVDVSCQWSINFGESPNLRCIKIIKRCDDLTLWKLLEHTWQPWQQRLPAAPAARVDGRMGSQVATVGVWWSSPSYMNNQSLDHGTLTLIENCGKLSDYCKITCTWMITWTHSRFSCEIARNLQHPGTMTQTNRGSPEWKDFFKLLLGKGLGHIPKVCYVSKIRLIHSQGF